MQHSENPGRCSLEHGSGVPRSSKKSNSIVVAVRAQGESLRLVPTGTSKIRTVRKLSNKDCLEGGAAIKFALAKRCHPELSIRLLTYRVRFCACIVTQTGKAGKRLCMRNEGCGCKKDESSYRSKLH